MSDGHDPCRKCGGNLWMHTHEMLQACGVVPDPKGEEIERLRTALTAATERAERAEADLTAARALLREALAWVHEAARNFGPPAAKSLRARIEALLGGER